MPSLTEQVRTADRDIAAVQEHIQPQASWIERLKADRRNTIQADALLATFQDILKKLTERRERLALDAANDAQKPFIGSAVLPL